jgi:hypothetical protein
MVAARPQWEHVTKADLDKALAIFRPSLQRTRRVFSQESHIAAADAS